MGNKQKLTQHSHNFNHKNESNSSRIKTNNTCTILLLTCTEMVNSARNWDDSLSLSAHSARPCHSIPNQDLNLGPVDSPVAYSLDRVWQPARLRTQGQVKTNLFSNAHMMDSHALLTQLPSRTLTPVKEFGTVSNLISTEL